MLRTRPPPLARPSAPRTRGLRGPARLVVNGAAKKKKLTPRERDAAPPALEVHDNPQPAWLPRTRISHGGGANESNVVAVPRRTFSNADADEPIYAVVGGHPEMALARANSREKISRETLRALDLDDRRRERPLRPVLPDVSVFAPEGTRRDVFDPTTNARLGSIHVAAWPHVDAAVTRAKKVQAKWAKVPGDERVRIVLAIADAIAKNATHLGNLLTLEVGKVPSESLGELEEIAEVAAAIGERADECGGPLPHPVRRYESRDQTRKSLGWYGEERALPIGIVGKTTAFNFPYAPFAWGALPALATGNGVVWKPHPKATMCAMALTKVIDDVLRTNGGFSGLVTCIDAGDDETLTRRMWRDGRFAMWECTSGEAMGEALLESLASEGASRLGVRTLLELGGNNAAVVHADADVAQAVESVLFGATGTAGQRCTSTRVAYVHDDVYNYFERLLVAGYKQELRIGDPFTPGVNVGPVFHADAVERFKRGVDGCIEEGSILVCGGRALGGNFVEPTLFRAPGFNHPPTATELFSPVLHLVRYRDDQLRDVVNDINRGGHGLSAGVFTGDEDVFETVATGVKVGIANLNYGTSGAEAGENFGGEGRTGGGRQMGPNMFRTYTRFVNTMRAPLGGEVVHAQGVSQKKR